jgi:hypothetical protein
LDLDGKRIEVTIPAGLRTASAFRFSGVTTDKIDVYVRVKVKPQPASCRKGDDLHREVPITLREALLGGEVQVKTLTGAVALRIPAETQNGRIFRLKGKGLPNFAATNAAILLTSARRAAHESERRGQGGAEQFLDLVKEAVRDFVIAPPAHRAPVGSNYCAHPGRRAISAGAQWPRTARWPPRDGDDVVPGTRWR